MAGWLTAVQKSVGSRRIAPRRAQPQQKHTAFVIQLQREEGGKNCFDKWKAFTGGLYVLVLYVCLIEILLTLSSIFAGNNNASGTMIDDKSKQWFGASVHSSGQDGIIVVRWHSFT